jgi:hypothetical protein
MTDVLFNSRRRELVALAAESVPFSGVFDGGICGRHTTAPRFRLRYQISHLRCVKHS